MTAEIQKEGTYAFMCDTCSESVETEHIHFHAALEDVKAKGWRRYKDSDGAWQYACPACVEDFANSQPQGRG